MKYKIIQYNNQSNVVYVKAAQTEVELEAAKVLPISLRNVTDVAELEKLIFTTWYTNQDSFQRSLVADQVEQHVIDSTDQVKEMIPDIELPQYSTSDAVPQDSTSTVVVL